MPQPQHEPFRQAADEMAEAGGPILGTQRARLGADRFAAFIEAHGTVQAMTLFLVISVMTTPQSGYSDDALDALHTDARDLREAAEKMATLAEDLADVWLAARHASQ